MKRAVIYARVSTEVQEATGTSLESQVAACERYADQNGYTVVEVFQEARSGATLNRPMLDEVREMVRQGQVDAVIFYALDRLSRDDTDTLLLAREWRDRGVEMKCATVALEATPQGQFLMTMLAAVGKLERAGIMERFMRGKRQTAKNGKIVVGGLLPYGYTFVIGEGRFELAQEEAVWVQRIFDWYVTERLSMYKIALRLEEMGAPTKRNTHWSPPSVRGILTNEAYAGEYWQNRFDTTGAKRKLRPREEWIGPVAIPPLVSREMYEAAQATIVRNTEMSPRNCKLEYLLRGLLICANCGKRFTGRNKITRQLYVCSGTNNAKYIGRPEHRCHASQVRADDVELKVWGWVESRLSNPDLLMDLVTSVDDAQERQKARDEADYKALVGVLSDLEGEENALIDLYTHKAITLAKFQERRAHIEDRRLGVENSLQEIQGRVVAREEAIAHLETVQEWCALVREGIEVFDFEQKRRTLEALRVRGRVNGDGTVTMTGLFTNEAFTIVLGEGNNLRKEQDHAPGEVEDARQDLP